MKLLTPNQMKEIDKAAIEILGIPGIILMENAAIQVVAKSVSLLNKSEAHITIVAGIGNNGGDAFAVARRLLTLGYSVSLYSMSSIEDLIGDSLTNARILINLGLEIPIIKDEKILHRLNLSCEQSDLVIDGLLGTGLNRPVEGMWARTIECINLHSKLILSIDIPSGVDGLTGKIMGVCIKADATVTFHLPKLGMVQYPGAAYTGEVTVGDIGIPYALSEELDTPILIDNEEIKGLLPIRPVDAHKGNFGKLLILAGSAGMTGAAYLSSLSAYRTGAGLVKLAVPRSCVSSLSQLIPEAVFAALPENEGHAVVLDKQVFKTIINDADAILIGPGLTCNHDTNLIVRELIECCEKPIVFDADALNILAKDKSLLDELRCEAIITPHPAEMARLMGVETAYVQANRIEVAKEFADEYGMTVVLKGAGTVIVSNDGRTSINTTGNEGMATAGSGDVLAGMIVSFLGQGLTPYEAAQAGVYYHGLAGDIAAKGKGTRSLIASDIAANISEAIK